MKKIIIASIFLLTAIQFSSAQTKAEKLFQAMVDEYQKNPYKAVMESASENYVLVSGSGYIVDKAKTAAIFKNVKNVEVSFQDLKVRQVGNTVIATGKEHSVRHHSDGTPDLSSDYLSSYVYEIKGDKLVYLSGQHTIPAQENINDEQANVRKTIEAETTAYHAGDAVTLDKQWANVNYVERQAEYFKAVAGSKFIKGENLRKFGEAFGKTMKPTGQTFKISDYEAHVGSTTAWVTYSQEVFNADGKPFNKTRETRILERTDGWKIVMMSFVEL